MHTLTHGTAHLSQVRTHYVTAGEGDAVVLLHGWPQTWYSWREVMALLGHAAEMYGRKD